jgi:D-alanine-D-alanine ligase
MFTAAILHDRRAAEGPPDQSDTLIEAQAIASVLGEIGFAPSIVPVGLDLASLERTLVQLDPRVVVNLVESLEGRGHLIHVVPALLESLDRPFTGCSAAALGLTSNKVLAKRQLRAAGIATPPPFDDGVGAHEDATAGRDGGAAHGEEDGAHDPRDAAPRQERLWIVKSVWEHASLGLDDTSIVTASAVADAVAARRAEYGGEWFAEEFVPGRELNVALIAAGDGPRVLPVAEIRFDDFPEGKPRIVGYAAKWDTASIEYRSTPRAFDVEPAIAHRVGEIALACWRLFGLDGYARVDFRVDAQGEPWVLEVNANPCLSPDAGFAAALAEAGVEYRAAIAGLVADALRRRDVD